MRKQDGADGGDKQNGGVYRGEDLSEIQKLDDLPEGKIFLCVFTYIFLKHSFLTYKL